MDIKIDQYVNWESAEKFAKDLGVDVGGSYPLHAAFSSFNPIPVAVGLVMNQQLTRAIYQVALPLFESIDQDFDISKAQTIVGATLTSIITSSIVVSSALSFVGIPVHATTLIVGPIIGRLAHLYATEVLMKPPFENSPEIVHLTQENFQKEVLESDVPVVVDAYASWCMPCNRFAPIFNELADQYAGEIKFAKFEIGEQEALKDQLGIKCFPTFLFYSDGKLVERQEGSSPKEAFEEKMQAIFAKNEETVISVPSSKIFSPEIEVSSHNSPSIFSPEVEFVSQTSLDESLRYASRQDEMKELMV